MQAKEGRKSVKEGRGNSFSNGNSMNNGNSTAYGPLRLVKSPSNGMWTVQSETHWDLTTEPKIKGLA